MTYTLLLIIKIYWWLIPEGKRRACLYNETCSMHVFVITKNEGLFKGIIALRKRYKTCRPNHEIIFLEQENVLLLKLADNTIIQEKDISKNIIKIYKINH